MDCRQENRRFLECPEVGLLRSTWGAQSVTMTLAAAICITILYGWLVPEIGAALPTGWDMMLAETAFGILLCVAGLFAAREQPRTIYRPLTRACGLAAVAIGLWIWLRSDSSDPPWLESLLLAGQYAGGSHDASYVTAMFLVLAGFTVALQSTEKTSRIQVSDVTLTLAVVQTMSVTAGYLFHDWSSHGATAISPHTLLAMLLLCVAMATRSITLGGFYGSLVGIGLGSTFLCIGMPWIFVTPMLLVAAVLGAVDAQTLSVRDGAAVAASISTLVVLLFSVFIARKLNAMESDLRTVSLSDELTGLHNRRGFNILGEHRFLEANRDHQRLALLYFDVDGLKRVNDQYGHRVGDELLKEFSRLLGHGFRHSDVLARLGGDEFAVLLRDDEIGPCLLRLEEAVVAANADSNWPFVIKYSVGAEKADPDKGDTLIDLIRRADEVMYREKLRKRVAGHAITPARETA